MGDITNLIHYLGDLIGFSFLFIVFFMGLGKGLKCHGKQLKGGAVKVTFSTIIIYWINCSSLTGVYHQDERISRGKAKADKEIRNHSTVNP